MIAVETSSCLREIQLIIIYVGRPFVKRLTRWVVWKTTLVIIWRNFTHFHALFIICAQLQQPVSRPH